MSNKTKKKYTKKSQIQHIIDRPDMYAGSTRLRKNEEYIAQENDNSFRIFKKEISFSPALLRIFVEALSNAIDNVERSKKTDTPCTKIKVDIDINSGETSVWNDGDIVPVEKNDEEDCYNHTMIFGQLLTGSNYNDEEERIVSGRNGLGIKLTNVFSKNFSVEGYDPDNKLYLKQNWENNMKTTKGPKIKKKSSSKGYTKVTWIPDFKLFGLEGYTQDIVDLYKKFVIDAAMLCDISVYLNSKKIPVNNISQYSKLYDNISDNSITIKSDNSIVLLTPSNTFESISFVNGVYTRLGGQHVDSWSESFFRPIVKKINKPKKPQVNIKDVKQFFRLFVVSTVIRPEFDGQDKNKLEMPSVPSTVKTTHINSIMKWPVISNIEDIIKSKELLVLKKIERKNKFTKIEGLDPANNSGGPKSFNCTLILCEGLSAKTYAVAGIQKGVNNKKGRDWFGIYALRGKLLNVRNSSVTSIAKNNVISDLIKSIGLRQNVDYTIEKNFKTLRYGQIMLMTDADVDGIHIEGLLINLFHFLFPSLLDRKEQFLVSMKTPIVRVFGKTKKHKDKLFYDERNFKKWSDNQTTKFKAKYYKGLGTTRPEDVPDTFGIKMVEYFKDELANININKVFNKRFSDERKKWLAEFNINNSISLDDTNENYKMDMTDFVNNELIKFSINDCKRSIPNGIDGLKESQRKIIYAVKKRNLKYSGKSLKVQQLGGYVAEHTNYHHGEGNLYDTIVKLANEFPGTNNIPLLYRDGMFGTRLEGGKDAASPRYIFTKMEPLTPLIYRDEDDVLLEKVIDDGDEVEPKFYVPILPMILINGCTAGIGTGWSCNVPCYNPLDMIDAINIWLDNDGEVLIKEGKTVVSLFPEFTPWYRGFKGDIKKDTKNTFITTGNLEKGKGKKDTCIINELPIGKWTNKFKEDCEDFIENKKLKSIKNYSTPTNVHFVVKESTNGFKCNIKNLKLTSKLYTSNIVLFDDNDKLNKMKDVDQVIDKYCIVRYKYYKKRKINILKNIEKELKHLGNKERFISEVISKKLKIMNIEEQVIISEMEKNKYDKENNTYDYLLRLQVRTFTAEKVKSLKQDILNLQNKHKLISNTTEKNMWKNELKEFKKEYEKWLKIINKL